MVCFFALDVGKSCGEHDSPTEVVDSSHEYLKESVLILALPGHINEHDFPIYPVGFKHLKSLNEHDDRGACVQGYLCFGEFLLDHVQILHEDWQVESHITLDESEGIENVQMPESLAMLMIDFLNDFANRDFDVIHDQEFDILQDVGR